MENIAKLKEEFPLIERLIEKEEVCWLNPKLEKFQATVNDLPLRASHIEDAEKRLQRFASYIKTVFPETKEAGGIIESALVPIPEMQASLEEQDGEKISGKIWLKCDSHLPISGSIKARGGIYEVLKHAEQLAMSHGMLTERDDYAVMANENFRDFFSNYKIAVGSTGNLGLSIGIMSAQLGFKVSVHMSADAKQWKKDLLTNKGVAVIEYTDDYSKAVEEGRKEAAADPSCHFVDDENSQDLFLGYAVAASRLQKQLKKEGIVVDEQHPLFVYLPCGVGGAPGGVAFGLKLMFKDNVHCFFAEPTPAPCMLLGMMTGLHENIAVGDIGLDNVTVADGLAVGRPSGFVGKVMESLLSGAYTVEDDRLFKMLTDLADKEDIYLEPSALAGMIGPHFIAKSNYLQSSQLEHATHIVWATGGSMVPQSEMESYYLKGTLLKA